MNNGSIQIEGSYDDVKLSDSFSVLKDFEKSTEKTRNDESNEGDDEQEVFSLQFLKTLITIPQIHFSSIVHEKLCR